MNVPQGACAQRMGRLTGWTVAQWIIGTSVGWCAVTGASIPRSGLRQRTFQFTYHADVTDLPPDAREVRIWVPLARTRANQQILSRRVLVAAPYEVYIDPESGNEMLHVALMSPVPTTFSLEVSYDALVQADRSSFSGPAADFPDEARDSRALMRYLRPEPLVILDEMVRRFSREATAGRVTDLDRARGVYDFVIAHMAYDKTTPGWGRGDTRRACLIGKGNCTDFHSLFISMARAAGLPARFVIGASIPLENEGAIAGYHCWAEVYTREEGWIPVDASEAWKHPELRGYYFGTPDPNKLLISVGRNLELVPPQRGGRLNMFLQPYVEVDGHPVQSVRTQFHFREQHSEEGSA